MRKQVFTLQKCYWDRHVLLHQWRHHQSDTIARNQSFLLPSSWAPLPLKHSPTLWAARVEIQRSRRVREVNISLQLYSILPHESVAKLQPWVFPGTIALLWQVLAFFTLFSLKMVLICCQYFTSIEIVHYPPALEYWFCLADRIRWHRRRTWNIKYFYCYYYLKGLLDWEELKLMMVCDGYDDYVTIW